MRTKKKKKNQGEGSNRVLIGLRLRLGVHKGMEWNDHKGMEMNGMEWNVLSKGSEWKIME